MEIKRDVFEKTSFILLVFYFIGLLVHNIFLTKFGTLQLDLFRGRYFFTGITTSLIITSIYLYMTIFIDLKNISNNFNIDTFLDWLGRLVIIPFLIIPYLIKDFFNSDVFSQLAFKLVYALTNMLLPLILLRFLPDRSEADKYWGKIFQKITKILSIPILFLLVLFSFHCVVLKSISGFLLIFGVGFWIGLYGRKDAQEGFYVRLSTSERQNSVIITFFFILSCVFLLSFYTKTLYEYIPQSFGGGRKIPASIYFNENSADVFIIDESQDWIIIEGKNKVASKIRAEEIKKIEYKIND